MKGKDETGNKYGRLTVICKAENYVSPNGQQKTQWLCECECGNFITVRGGSLKTGNTLSCGCLGKEHRATSTTKHGHRHDRLYGIWQNMKQRCHNQKNEAYCRYGAEGKSVCDEWQIFEAFYKWAVENGYSDGLTIERINNDKGYSPDNCRWASYKEQANNTRRNRRITHNGKTQTLAQWADEIGINYNTLYMRIYKLHWTIERAFMM